MMNRRHARVVELSLIETRRPRKRFAWRSLGFVLFWFTTGGVSAAAMLACSGDRVPAALLFGAIHLPVAWLAWKDILPDRWGVIFSVSVLEWVCWGVLMACFGFELS
jgi:hypothetical protein